MKNINKNKFIFILLILVVTFILFVSGCKTEQTPQEIIRQKITDVSKLRTDLINKSTRIDSLKKGKCSPGMTVNKLTAQRR